MQRIARCLYGCSCSVIATVLHYCIPVILHDAYTGVAVLLLQLCCITVLCATPAPPRSPGRYLYRRTSPYGGLHGTVPVRGGVGLDNVTCGYCVALYGAIAVGGIGGLGGLVGLGIIGGIGGLGGIGIIGGIGGLAVLLQQSFI